jgi:hypothetical protein
VVAVAAREREREREREKMEKKTGERTNFFVLVIIGANKPF